MCKKNLRVKKTALLYYKSSFFTIIFLNNTSEKHTATDLVNLLLFLRPVSSDYADFIKEFEQDG